jgi:hypothetical protein
MVAKATPTAIEPSSVRSIPAKVAAEDTEGLKASLLEAADSEATPVWFTVECPKCGERSRVEASVHTS